LCMAGLLLWILPVSSYGQFEDLKRQLENKNTLAEITATVEQFLLTLPESYEKERFTKHFNRWAYYWSLHLGPNGEFVHIGKKTLEALTSRTDAPLTSANGSWSFVGPSSSTLNNPDADINGIGRISDRFPSYQFKHHLYRCHFRRFMENNRRWYYLVFLK